MTLKFIHLRYALVVATGLCMLATIIGAAL